MSEASLLLSIHALASPVLDAVFLLSHELGTLRFCLALVLAAAAGHWLRGERRESGAWLAVGLTTLLLFSFLKPAFARPRPDLWPCLVEATGHAFPSGHALAAATFYPLLASVTFRLGRGGFALVGVGLPLFVGFGRLYLGVHWPSDVLAGWALGALQAVTTIRWIRARRTSVPHALAVAAVVIAAGWAGLRPDRAIRVATGFVSHTLCYGAFVSGQDPDQVYADVVAPMRGMGAAGLALRYAVDPARREVSATFAGGFASRAVHRLDRGCLLVHGAVPAAPPPLAAGRIAPPLLPPLAGPAVVQPVSDGLRSALDRAFVEPESGRARGTTAVVVVRSGRVVAERYAPGYGIDTPLMGWSMTKSVTSALVGILVREGRLAIGRPAPVAAWQAPGDRRGAITIDHLLRMTSGLALDETLSGFDPVARMLLLERDMAAFAESAPLEARPGARWRYTSGNALVLSRIVRDAAGGRGEDVLAFARRELFDPLGMASAILETDATGTPVGSSYMLASARDWARFGLLYLNDGALDGRRVLPEGWVRYSTSRTLDADYGAGFWLAPSDWRVARDAFWAGGMAGQNVVVVPSERLVIVRLGVRGAGVRQLVEDAIAAAP